MVLDGIIAGILNKYLAKYIKNLDSSNLDVGLLSGSVELTDLELKPEALAEFDVPLEVKASHIGRIYADIQWTGLFSNPLVVEVEDVFILVTPLIDQPYNEEKQKAFNLARKRLLLESVDTKRKRSDPADADDLSFIERLTVTIVNNIQVNVSKIHIRYEDSYSNPGHTLAAGVMLDSLSAQTTDENWTITQLDASATVMHKLAQLSGVSAYLNPTVDQKVKSYVNSNVWRELMKDSITSQQINGDKLDYLLHPLSTEAHFVFDKNASAHYNSPEILLDIITQVVSMSLSRSQYLCTIDILESFQLMGRRERYQKYRPNVPVSGNIKTWWKFAYTAVLEEHIRPWSATKIENHQILYRKYKEKYKEMLTIKENGDNVPSSLEEEIQTLEDGLDVTSIIIGRQKTRRQFAKEAPAREKKRKEEREASRGFFSRLFGWGEDDDDDDDSEGEEGEDIWSQLPDEERTNIYNGIGYNQGASKTAGIPPQFVKEKLSFELHQLELNLMKDSGTVLTSEFDHFHFGFQRRPVNNSLIVMFSTESLNVSGVSINANPTTVVTSKGIPSTDTGTSVLTVDFESKPLIIKADSVLSVTAEPIDIFYHEKTVSELMSFFTIPNMNVEGLKSSTISGIQHLAKTSQETLLAAINNHQTIQLNIDVKSPNIIIPEHGCLEEDGHLLIFDLGSLRVVSELQTADLALEDATPVEVEERLYDKFVVHLNDMKAVLSNEGEDWREVLKHENPDNYLVPCLGLQINVFISAKQDYKKLPQQKIEAILPALKFSVSDEKLEKVLKFIQNLPLPFPAPVSHTGPPRGTILNSPQDLSATAMYLALRRAKKAASIRRPPRTYALNKTISAVDDVDMGSSVDAPTEEKFYTASDHSDETIEEWSSSSMQVPTFDDNDSPSNETSMLLRFHMREIVLTLALKDRMLLPSSHALSDEEGAGVLDATVGVEYLTFRVDSLLVDAAVSNHGIAVQMGLRGIQIIDKLHVGPDGTYLHLLSSPTKSELISVLFRKVSQECLEFNSYYGGIEQSIVLRLSAINATFHRSAMLYLMSTSQKLQRRFETLLPTGGASNVASPTADTSAAGTAGGVSTSPAAANVVARSVTQFYAEVHVEFLCVVLCDMYDTLAKVYLRGLRSNVTDKITRTTVRASLQDFSVEDPLETVFYKKIVCLQDQTAFDVKFTAFKVPAKPQVTGTQPSATSPIPLDYSIRFRGGRIQTVLLGQFIKNLTAFFEPFVNQSTLDTAKDASTKAVQKQVDDIQTRGKGIQMDIEINAPVVYIPQNWQSPHCIVVHLGNLSLKSSLEETSILIAQTSQKIIMLNLSLKLSQAQVMRGLVDENQVLGSHSLIVEPVSFGLLIKQPLSKEHTRMIPTTIEGMLEAIKVNIGEQDIITTLAALRGNLSATSTNVTYPDGDVIVGAEIHRSDESLPSESTAAVSSEPKDVPTEGGDNDMAIQFDFDLKGVTVILYTNEPKLPKSKKILILRDPKFGLSCLKFGEVSLSATMNTKGPITAGLSLLDITLEDIRPNSPLAIKKLILKSRRRLSKHERRHPFKQEHALAPMIEAAYIKDISGNQQIDFTVDEVRVNIFVHYLLAIYNFLSSTLTHTGTATPMSPTSSSLTREISRSASGTAVENRAGQPEGWSGRALWIRGHLRKPEIVLFDDPTSSSSQVLVLKMEGNLAFQNQLGTQSLVANVCNIQMYSCLYSHPLLSAYQVLDPCAISVTRSVSEDRQETVAVDFTDVCFHISPRVVNVMLGVSNALSSVTQKSASSRPLTDDYDQENLWTPKPIFSHGFQRRKGSMKNMVDFAPVPEPSSTPTQKLTVQMPRLSVCLELEAARDHLSVMIFQIRMRTLVFDWSACMRAEMEMTLEGMIYNEKISLWEPFLEPVLEDEDDYTPWELLIKLVKADSHPILCSSPYDSLAPGIKDSLDGPGFGGTRSLESYPVTETETDSDSQSDTELEWDGHYSSSLLSSDLATPQDEEKPLPQDTVPSEDQEDSDSEEMDGFFGKVKGFFQDIFTSESDSEAEEAMEPAASARENLRRSDSGIASSLRLTSSTLASSDGKDEVDADEDLQDVESTATYLIINATEKLDISVTPWSIDVLQNLINQYSSPPPAGDVVTLLKEEAMDVTIINTAGISGKIITEVTNEDKISSSGITLITSPSGSHDHMDAAGLETAPLGENESIEPLFSHVRRSRYCSSCPFRAVGDSTDHAGDRSSEAIVEDARLELDGFHPIENFLPSRPSLTMLPLKSTSSQVFNGNWKYGLIRDVSLSNGKETVRIRSPLQLTNHCQIPLELSYKKLDLQSLLGASIPGEEQNEFTSIGVVQPQQTMDIPLLVAYHAGIYACPVDRGFQPNDQPIKWYEIQDPAELTYQCPPIKEGSPLSFFFRVTREVLKLDKPSSVSRAPTYILHIHPPITLHNFLPYDLVYSFLDTGLKFLLRGEKMDVHSVDLNQGQTMTMQVKSYLSSNWEGTLMVSREMKATETVAMVMQTTGNNQKHLNLLANSTSTDGAWDIFLYSPYWIVNKSELPVEIRASRSRKVFSTHSLADPVLFNFSSTKRRKAKLRVFDSVWSTSFSLDTVGSSGVIICRDEDHDRTYQFWMDIRLSNLSLTKIVTLMPYFLIQNHTDITLSYVEEGVKAGVWVNIKPGEVLPFWPGTLSMKLLARKATTPDILTSRPFSISTPNTTVLRMERGSALTVQVEGGIQGPTTVTFCQYSTGQAPVRLDNLCDDINLRFNQKNVGGRLLLRPHQSMLYTWDDPSADRVLTWNLYNRNKISFDCIMNRDSWGKVVISMDSIHRSMLPGDGLYVEGDDASVYSTDEEEDKSEVDGVIEHPLMARKERTNVFWVSYMDGLQRVFMVTQSSKIARLATQAYVSEQAKLELFASINGVGLSLINAHYEEVAYISLFSSPAKWEVETKPDKWKALTMELSGLLEDRFKQGEETVEIEGALEADFKSNMISKPVAGPLRRTYNPGVWFHLRQSDHFTSVHFKLHKIQIDNQLFDAYFPTVMSINPLPSEVLKKTGPKPFIEMSLLRKNIPEAGLDTIKYLKVLIQESSIRVDDGFLRSVLDIFSNLKHEEEEIFSLHADLDFIQTSLRETSTTDNTMTKMFFEYLHLSPLKCIVSFSLAGQPHLVNPKTTNGLLKFFLDSIGSTLTEVSEVELKLAYFERTNILVTQSQLLADAQDHYVSQAVKQAYVFILGLDVLGNPYGLFRDVKEGISDFFYEPYLGLIQGPGEFAEGLAKGVQSLLGHTVGGVADTLSGLSGTVGRALAFISFDEDYQKARIRRLQRHPDSLPKHLLYAGQGFVMGVIVGLTGIVSSPLHGAQEEGLKGFFKGVGKGVLGLVTKPFGGVADGMTIVLEGIERATDLNEMPVMRCRIPRFISPTQGVNVQGLQLYSPYKAVGNLILHNIRRKGFYETDIYFAHATTSSDSTPDVVIITNRHILVVEKCRWWGGWDLEQGDSFDKFSGTPIADSNKIIYAAREGSKQITREVDCGDPEVCKWLLKKLKFALEVHNQKDQEDTG
ncbi:intermembrane lipid transfer protein VPS13A-like isoform X2 [Apostichopus japonicus]|uniref:intermembrane lipid transfer protein VPS13A-like isoform X2 n=1 Tax=Stichopus japonicus TaxID=307972 RepID=UPI003AB62704